MRFELLLEEFLADGRIIVTNSSADAHSPGAEKTALAISGAFDVPLGIKFAELICKRPTTDERCIEEPLVSQRVSLRVVEIEWFRKLITVVPNGHHAAVRFEGEGMELARKALATGSDGPRPCLVKNDIDT